MNSVDSKRPNRRLDVVITGHFPELVDQRLNVPADLPDHGEFPVMILSVVFIDWKIPAFGSFNVEGKLFFDSEGDQIIMDFLKIRNQKGILFRLYLQANKEISERMIKQINVSQNKVVKTSLESRQAKHGQIILISNISDQNSFSIPK